MKTAKALVVAAVIGALAGCMTVTGTLYPMNKDAQNLGVLKATIHENWLAQGGTITCTLPDGEVLTGQYRTISSGSVSFGSGFGNITTPGGTAFGSGFGESESSSWTHVDFAALHGNRGTMADCKVYSSSGHGTGVCKMSNGGIFRVMF
ncbi:hypothetical protein [Acidithiobacillus sp.]|uniref:hypothetical protein n=1 Tax=Acidithiobacillus sp. TaxID=1872118 RepID=UPI003CFEE6E8